MIGELSSLATAVMWSGSAYAFAGATKRLGSVRVNINRLIIAAGLLALTAAVFQIDARISLSQWGYLTLSGFAGFVFCDSFLFKSYEMIGARLGALVLSFAPAAAAFFAWLLLGEVIAIWGYAGIAITLSGIALVVFEQRGAGDVPVHDKKKLERGIFYAFLAAVGQGLGLVLAKGAFREGHINGLVATMYRIVPSIIVLVPAAMAMK